LKKYHPSGNLKFSDLGIFQSLKFRNLLGKTFEFQAKFSPNTLGTYGLTHCPAMPFGNRKKIFQRIFAVQNCYNLKNITPLETRLII